jgi:molybdopterin/thiamine biosynthesis adenylyltransferase
MANHSPVDLVLSELHWKRLEAHLFQKDADEHGAVIAAGMSTLDGSIRLLAHDVFLAVDGVDYVEGDRGYRMLTADFVRDRALHCRDERLCYLAVHNHFGRDAVEFSTTDVRSHERGYPALRDILRGPIVGALVFAKNAVAGDLWFADHRRPLRSAIVHGANTYRMYPRASASFAKSDECFDRQARLFGDRGQTILRELHVGVIGLGGVGSIANELFARLGVGKLTLVDPDRLEASNVPRVVGSTMADIGVTKVEIAQRVALAANPAAHVRALAASVIDDQVARELLTCDVLILAADTMQARLVVNAIAYQYLIPCYQIGSKVQVDKATGAVVDVFSVVRPILPGGSGCLWCNGLINSDKLSEEALSEDERRAQRYVDDPGVASPSVITLNAVGTAIACNQVMMSAVGLRTAGSGDYVYVDGRTGAARYEEPRRDRECLECGLTPSSRYARGDARSLPTRR